MKAYVGGYSKTESQRNAEILKDNGVDPVLDAIREQAKEVRGITTVTNHSSHFLEKVAEVAELIDPAIIEQLVTEIALVKVEGGRLFIIGVGGGAGHASHAVCDFRKLCGVEAYAPTDNMSEFSARANDEGLDTVFTGWLAMSRLSKKDALLVFSVGGGDYERGVSINIARAVQMAKDREATVLGIVGRKEGVAARLGDIGICVPQVDLKLVTPLTEAFQAVIWHCIVSHPKLQVNETKW
jgi:D-sedoheptulose 7-phosphate isomerase